MDADMFSASVIAPTRSAASRASSTTVLSPSISHAMDAPPMTPYTSQMGSPPACATSRTRSKQARASARSRSRATTPITCHAWHSTVGLTAPASITLRANASACAWRSSPGPSSARYAAITSTGAVVATSASGGSSALAASTCAMPSAQRPAMWPAQASRTCSASLRSGVCPASASASSKARSNWPCSANA
ncbi:hypothetical protein ACFQV2_32385 [Actinokineospora soli]|uniref:Uncharacterized protein n=1 Tax=Actinokineospora soli TaxID=1048753 RepID=A0ABW2TXD2_9PSEU